MTKRPCLRVAREILLRGPILESDRLHRGALIERFDFQDAAFRKAGEALGAHQEPAGLRFFDSSVDGHLAFGPGAGLVVGVSLGTESLRSCLVDANGWRYHEATSSYDKDQLLAAPQAILNRIRTAVNAVLEPALEDDRLLVAGKLPLLGWGVAWPSPVDRESKSVGHALAHPDWRLGRPLNTLVSNFLGPRVRSYALNDAHAAAIAVAHRQTRSIKETEWPHPRLGLVVRLAGGIGSGIIIVDRPRLSPDERQLESGFISSILVGGATNHAGEVGHVPISVSFIEGLNVASRPRGVGPLKAVGCSCTPEHEPSVLHLEAFASARALARRLDRRAPMYDVLSRVLADQERPDHAWVLRDVGAVVAEGLLSPVAVLNPATITLTGSLAVPGVLAEVAERLETSHPFGDPPTITSLAGADNNYVGATGAALAVIRNRVHRRLDEILDRPTLATKKEIEALTVLINRPIRTGR
jgi:predicted NBD/HSP70 family sugar kinase